MNDRPGPSSVSASGGEWFASAFGERYLELYAHRGRVEAARALDTAFATGELAGRRVLDLACGAGRYLAELSARRAVAVGLDLSWPLLRRAREADTAATLVRADMRSIPFHSGCFDWTLSMFTSFGYFSTPREHAALACEIARVTRTGVLLDVPNPTVLAATLVPHSVREVEAGTVEERRWLEPAPRCVRKTIRLLARGTGVELERYEERVALFTLEELTALFAPCGLSVARAFGDYEGSLYDPRSSERMLLRLHAGDGTSAGAAS